MSRITHDLCDLMGVPHRYRSRVGRPHEQRSFARLPAPANPGGPASTASESARAKCDMVRLRFEPFWLCQWRDVVFIHLEADPDLLQKAVPFELDLFECRAFVSLVAFTLVDMRPRLGGRLIRWICRPFGTHRFLNVRTYVKCGDARGIHFLAEYLDAPWLNHLAGPRLYGLPFHVASLRYDHADAARFRGVVTAEQGQLRYEGTAEGISEGDCPTGTTRMEQPVRTSETDLRHFLLERYRAYTERNGRRGWFPVWHQPWRCRAIDAKLNDSSLLRQSGRWAESARLAGAHHSWGLDEVWMGLRRDTAD